MAEKPKVEFVRTPNHLKVRTSSSGAGFVIDQMANRAESIIRDAGAEYATVLRQDVEELTQYSRALAKASARDARLSKNVYRKAFDIKSQAGTFGYAVMTEIAGSLCDFIEAMDEAKRPLAAADGVAVAVLDMHVASLRLAMDRNMTGPIGPQESELVDGLTKAVRKTVGKATLTRGAASS